MFCRDFFVIYLQTFKKLFQQELSFFISLFILLSFSSGTTFSAEVQIPAEWGHISEKIQGTNGKTLVLIQEAHVDYSAQKSISEILKNLIENQSLRLILVEGGWDDMGLSYLRNYGSPEGRKEVAEKFLQEGMISAEEYLDVVSDFDMSLWGIEDPKLYEENMEAFLKIHVEQEQMISALKPLEETLNALKEKIFPEPVRQFEKKKELFEKGEVSFLGFLQSLKNLKPHQDFWQSFPNLEKFLKTSQAEAEVDSEKAEWEKQELIRALSKNLTKPEFERVQLVEAHKSLQDEQASLQSLLGIYEKYQKRLGKVSVQNLKKYSVMLEEMGKMDSGEIFGELEKAEQKILGEMLKTQDEKELAAISESFCFLKKLFELKLGPAEFEKFEKNPNVFQLSQWQIFIEAKTREFSLEDRLPRPDYKQIKKWIPQAKAFYQAAQKREEALIENTFKKIQAEKDPLTALIVGGFHSETLVRALKAKGYSVITVMPRFTPSDLEASSQHYFEILKYKWGRGPTVTAQLSQS